MKFSAVKKGDWIISKLLGATPWFVCFKYTGFAVIRKAPKVGKLISITERQLCNFRKLDLTTTERIK